MTRRGALLFGSLLLVFLHVSAHAATNFTGRSKSSLGPLVQPTQNIPEGERLVYDVYWMGVHVGFGELEVKEKTTLDGRAAYPVVAVARTNEVLSKIYPVEDRVTSWIDAETFQSLQFEKKVSEGFYRADEIVRYDERAKKGTYESRKNGSKKEFDIHTPVHDVVSAFYWTRRQPLEMNKTLKTVVNNGEKDYDLEVDVLGRQRKEMRGQGVVDTMLIEPRTRLQGILEKRGRVWVHLKNDPARTPALFTFKTPFGPIVGALRESSNRSIH